MKILYVTTAISWPLTNGGHIRRWNVLQGLLSAGSTDVLVFTRKTSPDDLRAFDGCSRCIPLDPRLLESGTQTARYRSTVGRGILTLLTVRPFEFQFPQALQLSVEVAKRVDFREYDVVWFATAHTAMAFREMSSVVSILDGDDFEYIRESALLWTSPWYGAKIWNYLNIAKLWWWERSLARKHEVVVRCSKEDRERHPADNIKVIPNGTNIPNYCERAPERRLLFVGLLSYPPNIGAMEWFLTKIWPSVRAAIPDAACDIVGKDAPRSIADHDGRNGVNLHGFVRDLAPLYTSAAATIAPLKAGSGTRLKIIEALAHAVPVISTTLGAFGIEAGAEQGLERCDSEEAFAAQCIAQLRYPNANQGKANAGRDFVREHYDWKTIQSQVADLARLVSTGSKSSPKTELAPA